MIKSFRLRLALLSALLTGLALAAFGLSTLWLIRNIKIERIDSEVRAIAEREASRPRPAGEWRDAELKVLASLGVREPADLLFLVQNGNSQTLYRSTHWPDAIEPARLPWPRIQTSQAHDGWGLKLLSEAQAQEAVPSRPPPADQAGRGPAGARPPRGERPPPWERPLPGSDGYRGERPPRREFLPRDMQRPADIRPPQDTRPAAAEPRLREGVGDAGGVRQPELSPAPSVLPERATEAPRAVQLPRPELPPPPPPPASSSMTQSLNGHLWRVGLARTDDLRIAVAVDSRVIDTDMKSIRNAYLLALPFALILIGLGGWFFSSRALNPLQKLTAAARKLNAEGLSQRISSEGEDLEFIELIEVFNRMLGRLERSFKQAHRFSADAAHELKTPLAILQGQLERAINKAEDGSPMQGELTSILDEVRRLSTISRKLLLLSQADAGRLNLHLEPFDLSRALTDLVEDTRMLAPHLQVTEKIHPGLTIMADGSLLRQVLHNLISNAIKYNVTEGWIHIATAQWGQRVEVLVSNSSPGIPVAERGRIFERFYRADPSHSRHVEGVGLGLSVSREIARAHGGDLVLKSDSNGSVQFSLLLSASAPALKPAGSD